MAETVTTSGCENWMELQNILLLEENPGDGSKLQHNVWKPESSFLKCSVSSWITELVRNSEHVSLSSL